MNIDIFAEILSVNGNYYDYTLLNNIVAHIIKKNQTTIFKLYNTIEYYIADVFHRDNGPAIVTPCTKEYFQYGLRHRDNGPAIIRKGKTSSNLWYKNNILHRINLPAVITITHKTNNIKKIYYVNGKHPEGLYEENFIKNNIISQHYKSRTDKIVIKYDYTIIKGKSRLYTRIIKKNNQLNSIDLPAYTEYDYHYNIKFPSIEKWFVDDVLHRVNGPAIIKYDSDGVIIYKSYYLNGIRHRTGGPAIINYNNFSKIIQSLQWFSNGNRHRTDGPAVINYILGIESSETNITLSHEKYYIDGVLHREDGPADIHNTSEKYIQIYSRNGKIHREDGPAKIIISKKSYHIFYYINGVCHNDNGPAMIYYKIKPYQFTYHKKNMLVDNKRININILIEPRVNKLYETQKAWYTNGLLHRKTLPAKILYRSGGLIAKSRYWYNNGLLHNDGAPAIILEIGNRKILYWYNDGEYFRDGGLPVSETHLDDKIISVEWNMNGFILPMVSDIPVTLPGKYRRGKAFSAKWKKISGRWVFLNT